MKRNMSDVWLRSLPPPEKGRIEVRDTKVPGLVMRMTSAGVVTWSLRTRTAEGKQTRPKLGTWPAMSIADAREAALAALVAVQKGGDPVAG